MNLSWRTLGFFAILSQCVLSFFGCGDGAALMMPMRFSHRVAMSPTDFAFTGFCAGPDAGAPATAVGAAQEEAFNTWGYSEAREIMEANGLHQFPSMIMLWLGDSESNHLIWAFRQKGTVSCLTSLQADKLTAQAATQKRRSAFLNTRVDLPACVFDQGLRALCESARKGEYTVGAISRFQHGAWAQVVAYDRDREWFLRATVVDPDVLKALDMLIALGAFAPGHRRSDVVGKMRQMLSGVGDLPSSGQDANRLFGVKVDSNMVLGEETDWRQLLKHIDQDWDKCLPFLVAMHLVWPKPFPFPEKYGGGLKP